MISRRCFLSLAAPAIVCAANIMPVRSIAHLLPAPAPRFDGVVGEFAWRQTEDGGIDVVPAELLPPEMWRALTAESTDYCDGKLRSTDRAENYAFQWRTDRGQLTLHTPPRLLAALRGAYRPVVKISSAL